MDHIDVENIFILIIRYYIQEISLSRKLVLITNYIKSVLGPFSTIQK